MPLVQDAVARGVVMRRARIVSEPVTDYIRYEHAITPLNLQVGEDVRWLPRRRASDIPLPGNDFWLLDERLMQFHHFTGTGDWAPDGKERTTDPAEAALCAPGVNLRDYPHSFEERPAASAASNDTDAPCNGGGAHERTHTRRPPTRRPRSSRLPSAGLPRR